MRSDGTTASQDGRSTFRPNDPIALQSEGPTLASSIPLVAHFSFEVNGNARCCSPVNLKPACRSLSPAT